MRGWADRRRPRGLRPSVPAGRQTLPVVLAALAIVAAASTTASGARVTGSQVPGRPEVAGVHAPPPSGFPPEASPPSTSATSPAVAGPAGASSSVGCAPGACDLGPSTGEVADGLAANGIPTVALAAYQAAERRTAADDPGCGISWSMLAAIGRVESNHGRFSGASLLKDGRSDPPILGIALDGRPGVARITDTDRGRYDGDATFDRAVGPMQFIPSTWAMFAVDGDADGRADPFDIDDVSLAAARYLCEAGGDLRTLAGQRNAIFSYNHSDEYVRLVLDLAAEYAKGIRVDDLPAPDRDPRPLPPLRTPTLPPATLDIPPATTTPKPTPSPTTPKPTPSRTTPRPAPSSEPPATRPPSPTTASPTTTSPTTPPSTTPAPSPTCTPAPTPTGSPTTSPTPTPSPTTTSPTPTPTPTDSPTTSPSPTPSPSPTCPS